MTMPPAGDAPNDGDVLSTPDGPVPLEACELEAAGRNWSVLHAGLVLTEADEKALLEDPGNAKPYGLFLWPAAIALAYELASHGPGLHGRSLLELGSGAGLPGMVAAALGARVVQVDRNPLAMALCERNGRRNGVDVQERLLADWLQWQDETLYDWIVGSDVIYAELMHPRLEQILTRNLRPGGRVLLADPLRWASLGFLDRLDAQGWSVAFSNWKLGAEPDARAVAVFSLSPPAPAAR